MAAVKTVEIHGKLKSIKCNVPTSWEGIKSLGSGAYATVASFQTPHGEVAVKKVEGVFDHPVLALRTLREIRLLKHFDHPNILNIRELFVEGPEFKDAYLVLDLMDGDLNQLIHSKSALTDFQVQCVLYQIIRGLLCLLNAHVLHRDLKPGNILVRAGGEVKIADMGLARTIDAEDDCHDDAVLTEYVVTRYYRAPEVVLTATQYTYAVDMWSTGCIFGEMLMRKPLFEGKDSLDQIRKIVLVMGDQSPDEMSWIPRSSPGWKFMEKCANPANGETFQKLLRWPGANPVGTELLGQMLRFHPLRRISVEDCLRHRYLESFGADEDPMVQAARAVKPVDWSFDRELCSDQAGQSKPFDMKAFRRAFFDAVQMISKGGSSDSEPAPMNAVREAVAATSEGEASPPRRWGRRWGEGSSKAEGPPST